MVYWFQHTEAMRQSGWSRSGKVKLSGAVLGWTVAVLEKFQKDADLPTRSTALCEALAQWAKDYAREAAMERVLAKYGGLYRKSAAREEADAVRFLPLFKQRRALP